MYKCAYIYIYIIYTIYHIYIAFTSRKRALAFFSAHVYIFRGQTFETLLPSPLLASFVIEQPQTKSNSVLRVAVRERAKGEKRRQFQCAGIYDFATAISSPVHKRIYFRVYLFNLSLFVSPFSLSFARAFSLCPREEDVRDAEIQRERDFDPPTVGCFPRVSSRYRKTPFVV